jgi:hypothetical protein
MISSVITFRLKRRNALSIDSLLLTDIKAIRYLLTSFWSLISMTEQTIIRHFFTRKGK